MIGEAELTAEAQARVGSVLARKYRLLAILGIGGMGAVYAAVHRNGGRVAVKMLHRAYATSEDVRRRFVREGLVANRVGHPGVVRIVDDDRAEDGSVFLVMELLDGLTCRELAAQRGGRLGLRDAVIIARGVLDALEAAHREGVIHRDIKPTNVFVTRSAEVKLLDFGIARLRESAGMDDGLTRTGAVLGTPGFMSPEQAMGRTADLDARSDLWAVGALLFTFLTGRPVHDGENAQEIAVYTATRPAPRLRDLVEAPAALAAVVDRALALAAVDRWPSAAAMREALDRAMAESADAGETEGAEARWAPLAGLVVPDPLALVMDGATLDPLPERALPDAPTERMRPAGSPAFGISVAPDPPATLPPARSVMAEVAPITDTGAVAARSRRPARGRRLAILAVGLAASVGLTIAGVRRLGPRAGAGSLAPPRVGAVSDQDACTALGCGAGAVCAHGRCCRAPATTGAPTGGTSTLVYWQLAAPATTLEATVTIEEAPAHAIAMNIVPLRGVIDGQPFAFALQTDVYDADGTFGRGVWFVRYTTGDTSEIRTAPHGDADGPWDGVGGVQVSLRQSYDWRGGTYRLRLRRAEAAAHRRTGVAGDWFELSSLDLRLGEETPLGAVWFARATPTVPASFATGLRSYLQFYPRQRTVEMLGLDKPDAPLWSLPYAETPAWSVATMVAGDGAPARGAASRYLVHEPQPFANSNIHYDAATDRVVAIQGGMTPRCHPAAVLFSR